MPTYRVTVEDEYEDTIEEIWRSYRASTQTRVIEIEAEDEDEAEQLVLSGMEGTVITDDWDYGDSCDSEYWENGDTIDSSPVEQRIAAVVTLAEAAVQAEAQRQRYEEMIVRSRVQHQRWMDNQTYGDAPRVVDTPAWKL